jgi:hypothetical protein
MNLITYANRLYSEGHEPQDFAELAPGLVIVEPLRPGEITQAGVIIPERARHVDGQFALSHVVIAHAPGARLGGNGEPLALGDVVKCREAHLDPVDPRGKVKGFCSIYDSHIIARVARGSRPADTETAA